MAHPSRAFYKSEAIENDAHKSSDEVRAFFTARNKRHFEALERAHALVEQFRPTAEDRAARARVRDRLIEAAGRDDVTRLKTRKQAHWEALRNATLEARVLGRDLPLRPLQKHPIRESAVGPEMWWARTAFSWPSPIVHMWWDPAAGVRFFGKIEDESGDLQQYWIKVIAQFEIDTARLPPANRSYLSAPVVNVSGWVSSITDSTSTLVTSGRRLS